MSDDIIYFLCHFHPTEKLEYTCSECDTSCCKQCIIEEEYHKGHKTVNKYKSTTPTTEIKKEEITQPQSQPSIIKKYYDIDYQGMKADDVKLVMDQTGASIIDCINALKKHDNDIVNAILDII